MKNRFNSIPLTLDTEVFVDHPIFHATVQEIESATDLSKYTIPKGKMISKDKARVTCRMICDFEEFVERVEDLCEDNLGLMLTYRNKSSDHSHYYDYLATDSKDNVVASFRLRLRISNHEPKQSKEQCDFKNDKSASEKLHELLPEYQIAEFIKYPKIIIVNDSYFNDYDDAFEASAKIIEESVSTL